MLDTLDSRKQVINICWHKYFNKNTMLREIVILTLFAHSLLLLSEISYFVLQFVFRSDLLNV